MGMRGYSIAPIIDRLTATLPANHETITRVPPAGGLETPIRRDVVTLLMLQITVIRGQIDTLR